MNAELERDLASVAEALRCTTVAVRAGREGQGSGLIWSSDGTIVTNAHVAHRERLEVVLCDGRSFVAKLARRDAARDLALLRVDVGDLPVPEIRDPSDLRPGELLVAVGHPFGVPNALTMGIAHAALGHGTRRFVQADLRLAPGNSGGPIADARGRVVGINSMVVGGGLALAVPSDDVRRFVEGAVRARLGVALAAGRLRNGAPALVVVAIEPGSRAQRAGLRVGDVLPPYDPSRLRELSSRDVLRGGVRLTIAIPPHEGARAA